MHETNTTHAHSRAHTNGMHALSTQTFYFTILSMTQNKYSHCRHHQLNALLFKLNDHASFINIRYTYNVDEAAWSADRIPIIPLAADGMPGAGTGARMGSAAAVCGTPPRLYVAGGTYFNGSLSGQSLQAIPSVQSIDVLLQNYKPGIKPQWKDHASLQNARRDFGLACFENTLYAVGGRVHPERDINLAHSISSNKPYTTVETFDTANPYAKWKELNSRLRVGRSGLALLVVGNSLLALGGEGEWQSSVATVETLDLADTSASWQLQPHMLSGRALSAGVAFNPTGTGVGNRNSTVSEQYDTILRTLSH